jgi:hypothetical protein
MIRNFSLGQIFKNNSGDWAANQLKEICYGRGFAMIDGKMHPLGMCGNSSKGNPKAPKFFDNATPNTFFGECTQKPGAWVTRINQHVSDNQM